MDSDEYIPETNLGGSLRISVAWSVKRNEILKTAHCRLVGKFTSPSNKCIYEKNIQASFINPPMVIKSFIYSLFLILSKVL